MPLLSALQFNEWFTGVDASRMRLVSSRYPYSTRSCVLLIIGRYFKLCPRTPLQTDLLARHVGSLTSLMPNPSRSFAVHAPHMHQDCLTNQPQSQRHSDVSVNLAVSICRLLVIA